MAGHSGLMNGAMVAVTKLIFFDLLAFAVLCSPVVLAAVLVFVLVLFSWLPFHSFCFCTMSESFWRRFFV